MIFWDFAFVKYATLLDSVGVDGCARKTNQAVERRFGAPGGLLFFQGICEFGVTYYRYPVRLITAACTCVDDVGTVASPGFLFLRPTLLLSHFSNLHREYE
jgi:hypothetical protein